MSRNALQNPVMREQIEYGKYYVKKWLHNLAFARNERFRKKNEIIDYRMSAEYVMV